MLTTEEITEIEAALSNYEEAKDSFIDRDDLVAGAAWEMSDVLRSILKSHID